MINNSYTTAVEIQLSPRDVFNKLNDVSNWWAKSAIEAISGQKTEFSGQSSKLNDEFIIRSGNRHYSKQKLVEFIPTRKVVWLVVESKLNWIQKNKNEWTGTKMIFEISSKGNKTMLKFTHEGLFPEHECYSNCALGWDMLIKERLYNFMFNSKK